MWDTSFNSQIDINSIGGGLRRVEGMQFWENLAAATELIFDHPRRMWRGRIGHTRTPSYSSDVSSCARYNYLTTAVGRRLCVSFAFEDFAFRQYGDLIWNEKSPLPTSNTHPKSGGGAENNQIMVAHDQNLWCIKIELKYVSRLNFKQICLF